MIDLDTLRDEYANYLRDNKGARHPMDEALMHVLHIAYELGAKDERDAHLQKESQTNDKKDITHGINITSSK